MGQVATNEDQPIEHELELDNFVEFQTMLTSAFEPVEDKHMIESLAPDVPRTVCTGDGGPPLVGLR